MDGPSTRRSHAPMVSFKVVAGVRARIRGKFVGPQGPDNYRQKAIKRWSPIVSSLVASFALALWMEDAPVRAAANPRVLQPARRPSGGR